jgi:AcrR family transcriptional regulator
VTTVSSKASVTRKYTPRIPPEERKDQILDAVLEVISEQGTSAVSVDGIARRLGFTRPVVYGLFTDSDHMLRESLKREEQRAIAQIADVIPLGMTGTPEAIRDAFRAYLLAVLAEPARWRAILLPIGTPPALIKTLRRGRQQFIDLLAGMVSEAPALDLDTQLAGHMLLTIAEEAGRLVLTEPESYSPDRIADFAETLSRMAISAVRSAP